MSEMANKLKWSQGRIYLNKNLLKGIKESQKNKQDNKKKEEVNGVREESS